MATRVGRGIRGGKTLRSFQAAALRIAKGAKAINRVFPGGMRMIGEEIMTDVKASRPGHGVPVDEGTLRSTGMVEGPAMTATNKPTVALSFGGAAAPYALAQHERMDYVHPLGEARYLVRGVQRWRPGVSVAMMALRLNAQAGLAAVAASGGGGGTRQGRDVGGRFTKGFK